MQESVKAGITVKLTETDIFKKFLKEYESILEDERIDESIREEYYTRLEELICNK